MRSRARWLALLGLLSGTPIPADPFIEPEDERAGRVFIYNGLEDVEDSAVEDYLTAAVLEFQNAGITFGSMGVVSGDTFPTLTGLDLLIYLVRDHAPIACLDGGVFGLGEENDEFGRIRDKLNVPYDVLTSQTHTGYLDTGPLLASYDQAKIVRSKRERGRVGVQAAVKQIARGLGASRVLSLRDGEPWPTIEHFMGRACPQMNQTFYSGNLRQMRDFIRAARMLDDDKAAICELRDDYSKASHLLKYQVPKKIISLRSQTSPTSQACLEIDYILKLLPPKDTTL